MYVCVVKTQVYSFNEEVLSISYMSSGMEWTVLALIVDDILEKLTQRDLKYACQARTEGVKRSARILLLDNAEPTYSNPFTVRSKQVNPRCTIPQRTTS